MKESELRKYAKCKICNNGIAAQGIPLFFKVTAERHGLKRSAITRQDGLAAVLGGHSALAAVMGPDEDMTEMIGAPKTYSVCEACCHKHPILYMLFLPG